MGEDMDKILKINKMFNFIFLMNSLLVLCGIYLFYYSGFFINCVLFHQVQKKNLDNYYILNLF
jgi:hypothetical protein